MKGLSARMSARFGLRIVVFAVLYAAMLLVVNLGVMLVGLGLLGRGEPSSASAAEVAAALEPASASESESDPAYRLSDELAVELDESREWAMLIDASGQVAWSYGAPESLVRHYSLSDVASFTRWYLDDYPVSTWKYDDGVVVVGQPVGSLWKYPVSQSTESLAPSLAFLAVLLAANFLAVFFVARAYAHRGWKERDDARKEWIAAVSHDVRTPLAVVMAESSVLASDGSVPEASRRSAERILAKSSEMSSLIADLNVANRLRSAMSPDDSAELRMDALLRSVVIEAVNDEEARSRPAAPSHSFELELGDGADGLRVRGSDKLLRRMLANLLGNAVRHNPQGCAVRLSLSLRPGLFGGPVGRRCLIEVRDDGRGFGSDELSLLARKPGRELPEHGLGLVIVRRIAAAHGGAARFSNNPEGGSCCLVELPAL